MVKSERPVHPEKISLYLYEDQVKWFRGQHRINMSGFIRKALDHQIEKVREVIS